MHSRGYTIVLVLCTIVCVWQVQSGLAIIITDPPTWRDPLQWPFADWSIWNLPIGQDAVFVPANIVPAGSKGTIIEGDPDVILVDYSNDTMTPYYYNSAGWKAGQSRCPIEGAPLFLAPWPSGFVVPSDGNNYAAAILLPNGTTIRQGQPLCCCVAGGNVTIEDGAHGGTGLSSIGGTLRLGELLPIANGSSIVQLARHALKGNLFANQNYWRGTNSTNCYRWPARWCDGYFNTGPLAYNGTNPALRTGALLALPSTVDITKLGLQTTPALYLAWTLQNYGIYLADDSAWPAFALETELSPKGDYRDQFKAAWGFSFTAGPSSPWGQDVQTIFQNLNVVDNWNLNLYNIVKASNGTMGAGGGAPLQSWAPTSYTDNSDNSAASSMSSCAVEILIRSTLSLF